MNRKEFIDLFVEELEIEDVEVTEETELASLGEWDSMGVMIFIGIVSENFDKTLKAADIKSLTTVKSLIELIGVENFEN